MAARTIDAPIEDWQRVAARVRQRRLSLNRTAPDVVERGGPGISVAVVSRVENARQDVYSRRTLMALCRGLDWTPDSIERILRGEEPMTAPDLRNPRPLDHPDVLQRLEELEAEIRELRAALGQD